MFFIVFEIKYKISCRCIVTCGVAVAAAHALLVLTVHNANPLLLVTTWRHLSFVRLNCFTCTSIPCCRYQITSLDSTITFSV